jgi:hypothetical protein
MGDSSSAAVKISLFKDSYEPFVALLKEDGIEFGTRPPQVGVVMNSGLEIAVVVTTGLVKVIIAYLKAGQSRKVIITTKANSVVHFQAEVLSQAELERILPLARNMAVIETKRKLPGSGSETTTT